MADITQQEVCDMIMRLNESYLEKVILYVKSLQQEEIDIHAKQKAFERLESLIEKDKDTEFLPYNEAEKEAITAMEEKYGAMQC